VVVELIGGTTTAYDMVCAALRAKKIVVTGNKALLAERGQELFALAEQCGVPIYFEAAVAGGIPIIQVLQEGPRGESHPLHPRHHQWDVQLHPHPHEPGWAELCGCLAGGTGQRLCRGGPLSRCQRLGCGAQGHHPRLPELRLLDSRRLCAWRAWIASSITDFKFAKRLGYTIKLLSVIRADENGLVEVRTQPTLVPLSHVLASVSGSFNAVLVNGDIVGETLFYGRGAGQDPTSSSVISDLCEAAAVLMHGARHSGFVPHGLYGKSKPVDDTISHHYLRLTVDDVPGVLARWPPNSANAASASPACSSPRTSNPPPAKPPSSSWSTTPASAI
jgi:homoserine dehydrogenase